MELPKLGKPIGIALLPKSKKMVIGDTASNHVKIFSREGMFMKCNYFHMGYTVSIPLVRYRSVRISLQWCLKIRYNADFSEKFRTPVNFIPHRLVRVFSHSAVLSSPKNRKREMLTVPPKSNPGRCYP